MGILLRRPLAGVAGILWLSSCACGGSDSAARSDGQWYESNGSSSGGSGTSGTSGASGATSSGRSGAGGPGATPPRAGPPPPQQDAGIPSETCRHSADEGVYTVYQSADDSNSMASPAIARALIQRGGRVPGAMLRTYEFLNYYQVRFTPPEQGSLRVVPQMARQESGDIALQVGIQAAPALAPRQRVLTFVLDTSGSMSQSVGSSTSLELLKAAVHALADNFREGDIVNVVTWDDAQYVPVDSRVVTGPGDRVVLDAVDAMEPGGSTDLHGGLTRGYQLAAQHYDAARLNRVILISDGMANTGVTDEELIATHAHTADQEGIYLVGIGVGLGVNDMLMDIVTDRGRGAYVYLDTTAEAEAVLRGRFDEVLEVAARGVRLQLDLPWFLQVTQFSGEQISTDPREVDPQHLAPGDSMIFNQRLGGCDSAAWDEAVTLRFTATWRNALDVADRVETVETTLGSLLGAETPQLAKGLAIVAYVDALRRADEPSGNAAGAIDGAVTAVDHALTFGDDTELREIRGLLVDYRRLF